MALEAHERRIGEHSYRVTQLRLNDALRLLPIVLRVAGPTLAAVLDGRKTLGEITETEVDIGGAVSEFARSLCAADLIELSDAFAKSGAFQNATGAWIPLDSQAQLHFPPRYQEWLGFVLFAIGVNFASFLGGVVNVRAAIESFRKGPVVQSPTGSTGTSGGS